MRHKILINLLLLTLGILIAISYYHYTYQRDIKKILKLNNILNIERDFELYAAIKEDNVSKINENIKLYFMFHLTPIETSDIEDILDVKKMERLCKRYQKVLFYFNKEYKKEYPKSILKFQKYCFPRLHNQKPLK